MPFIFILHFPRKLQQHSVKLSSLAKTFWSARTLSSLTAPVRSGLLRWSLAMSYP
jgi:hypothetical protein